MTDRIRAWAVNAPKAALTVIDYAPGVLGAEQVEIAVSHCGICHSDLSMLDNEWGISRYPLVAGHEMIGTIRTGLPHERPARRSARRPGLVFRQLHALYTMHGRRSQSVPRRRTDYRRPLRRIRRPRALSLVVGDPPAGRTRRARGRTVVLRWHHGIHPDRGIRHPADPARRRDRHRRTRSHGVAIPARLGLRCDGVHLERRQGRQAR